METSQKNFFSIPFKIFFKLVYNVSHSFSSLFNVKRPLIGAKVRFQPIVSWTLKEKTVITKTDSVLKFTPVQLDLVL